MSLICQPTSEDIKHHFIITATVAVGAVALSGGRSSGQNTHCCFPSTLPVDRRPLPSHYRSSLYCFCPALSLANGTLTRANRDKPGPGPLPVPLHKHLCHGMCTTTHTAQEQTHNSVKRKDNVSAISAIQVHPHNSFNDLQASFVVSRSASSFQYCKMCVVFSLSLCKFTTAERPGSTRSTHPLLAVVFPNPPLSPKPRHS